MASLNPSLYHQTAEHIKLQLQTRRRGTSTSYLETEDSSNDGDIARGLNDLLDGIENMEREADRREAKNDSSSHDLRNDASSLRTLYNDLDSQYKGFPTSAIKSASPTSPKNEPISPSSNPVTPAKPRRTPLGNARSVSASKSVHFTDIPSSEDDPSRNALFPYRDDPSNLEAGLATRPSDGMSNPQMLSYHDSVMREQDEQLDMLGESIGRQRQLGAMIGDELDDHVQMLEEVDGHVDRQQGRLEGARERIGHIARKANDNKQITVIAILVVVLVLLIIILKT